MSKLPGTVILLKLILPKRVNQLKPLNLNTLQMNIMLVLLIMVFNSISMLDLSIQLMVLDKILRCILYI
jgi:hypothetical protein